MSLDLSIHPPICQSACLSVCSLYVDECVQQARISIEAPSIRKTHLLSFNIADTGAYHAAVRSECRYAVFACRPQYLRA